jgi:hypothetical protein
MFKKIQCGYLLKKNIKWCVWRVAVCPSYIQNARFLKVKWQLGTVRYLYLRRLVPANIDLTNRTT